MKAVAYVAGLLGLALLIALLQHADLPVILNTWRLSGAELFWLIPYRIIFFALYALGWRAVLGPFDRMRRVGFGYLLWVTAVREAVDRLLPVASVGCGVVGVRLTRWRGLATIPVSATVLVEILLTLFALYMFGGLATLILLSKGVAQSHWQVLAVLLVSLPIPVASLLLLRYGSVFQRLQRFLGPMVGLAGAETAAALDRTLRFCLARVKILMTAGALQFLALVSASFEVWWALRLFDHPVSLATSVMLEGLSQAVRHLAFIVPAGLGIQEAALAVFGHAVSISTELALAISAVKRMREVLCGVPLLLSWQWLEARRLRQRGAGRSS